VQVISLEPDSQWWHHELNPLSCEEASDQSLNLYQTLKQSVNLFFTIGKFLDWFCGGFNFKSTGGRSSLKKISPVVSTLPQF
jgi:hypothetical protein